MGTNSDGIYDMFCTYGMYVEALVCWRIRAATAVGAGNQSSDARPSAALGLARACRGA